MFFITTYLFMNKLNINSKITSIVDDIEKREEKGKTWLSPDLALRIQTVYAESQSFSKSDIPVLQTLISRYNKIDSQPISIKKVLMNAVSYLISVFCVDRKEVQKNLLEIQRKLAQLSDLKEPNIVEGIDLNSLPSLEEIQRSENPTNKISPEWLELLSKWAQQDPEKELIKTMLTDFCSSTTKTRLDFQGMKGIDSLPKEIFLHPRFEELKEIDLSKTGIKEIPLFLQDCTNLSSLDLSNNPIDFNKGIKAELPNLKHLDLSNTGMKTVPSFVSTCKALRVLLLRENLLKEKLMEGLAPIAHHLEILDVSSCLFETIPDSIQRFTALTSLNLSGNQLSRSALEPLREFVGSQFTVIADVNISKNPSLEPYPKRLESQGQVLKQKENSIPGVYSTQDLQASSKLS